MTHGARFISILFWSLVAFLVAPSKAAAVGYALLLGGTLIVLFVGLGLGNALLRQVSTLFARRRG